VPSLDLAVLSEAARAELELHVTLGRRYYIRDSRRKKHAVRNERIAALFQRRCAIGDRNAVAFRVIRSELSLKLSDKQLRRIVREVLS